MKIAMSTLLYKWNRPLKDAIKTLAALNYNRIEIRAGEPDAAVENLTARYKQELKDLIAMFKLEVLSLTPDWVDLNLASPSSRTREESVARIKGYLMMARDFGAWYFTILPGKRPIIAAPPIEKCRKWSLESLSECVSLAEKTNVTLCLEGAPGQVVEKEEDLINFVKEINSKRFLLAADTSHAYIVSEPVSYFKKIRNYIGIVHIADNDGVSNAHLPLGLGKIDFAAIFEALREIEYNGYYILELWYPENPDWAAKQSRAFVARLIRSS